MGEEDVEGPPWSARPFGQGQEGGAMGTLDWDAWATVKMETAPHGQ